MLKMQCARAVLFAFLFWVRLARIAVMVVPILSPRRIGMAPESPIMLAVVPTAA